jgi:hypothetical protein
MFANLFKQNIQGLMADWPGGVADFLLRHFCFYLGFLLLLGRRLLRLEKLVLLGSIFLLVSYHRDTKVANFYHFHL